MVEDRFTNTVEDAAQYERMVHGDEYDDDGPTLAECQRDEADAGPRPPRCTVSRGEGLEKTWCRLPAGHLDGRNGRPHEPGMKVGDDPWAVALADSGLDWGEPPF